MDGGVNGQSLCRFAVEPVADLAGRDDITAFGFCHDCFGDSVEALIVFNTLQHSSAQSVAP